MRLVNGTDQSLEKFLPPKRGLQKTMIVVNFSQLVTLFRLQVLPRFVVPSLQLQLRLSSLASLRMFALKIMKKHVTNRVEKTVLSWILAMYSCRQSLHESSAMLCKR